MRQTAAEAAIIEHLAQEQLRFEIIFEEQASVLRTDKARRDAAVKKLQETPFIAKQGQRWQPTQENADQYLAWCEDICRVVPQNFDDRVKIMHGAHAALLCLVTCKFAQQSDRVQQEILGRHNHLMNEHLAAVGLISNTTSSTTSNHNPPLSKPSVEPRRPTVDELRSFRNPEILHGKQFILSPGTSDSGMYEVVAYSKARDKTVRYDVLFDDCDDPITIDAGEMMRMLEDSLYLPAS